MHNYFKPLGLTTLLLCAALASNAAQAARVALIMANEQYQSLASAKMTGADADAISATMRQAGYTVTVVKNRNLQQMRADLRQFRLSVKGGDEVFFYFGGHGVQIGGMNYVLPVDILAENEAQVADEALPLSKILGDLREQQPALTFAVIDAARENPFKTAGRAIGTRGLAPVSGYSGQMVLYSTGNNQHSLERLGADDYGRNSIFARTFVSVAGQPGLTVDQIARNVREQVSRLAAKANHAQVPAVYDQVLGKFYLKPPLPGQTSVDTRPQVAAPATGGHEQEVEFWNTVRNATNPAELEAYLQRYPSGQFIDLARERIKTAREARSTAPASVAGTARPTLPFVISPEIWTKIEQSEALKDGLPIGPARVKYKEEVHGAGQVYTSTHERKVQSITGSPASYAVQTEFKQPVGSPIPASTTIRYSAMYFLPLGTTINGTASQKMTRLNEISGKLFPMKAGNQLIVDFEQDIYPFNKTLLTKNRMDCRVKEKVSASTMRPELLGDAWPIVCATRTTIARETFEFPKNFVYFEAGNVIDSMISPIESPTEVSGLPKADALTIDLGATKFNFSNYQLKIGQ